MARRKARIQSPPALWSITFRDLMMLLLGFFILRYSLMGRPTLTEREELPAPRSSAPSVHVVASEPVVLTSPFRSADHDELTLRATTVIQGLAAQLRDRSTSVTITTLVSPSIAAETEFLSPWSVGTKQLEILTRQFSDAGVLLPRIRTRLRTAWDPAECQSDHCVTFTIGDD